VRKGLEKATAHIPSKMVTVSTRGKILEEQRIA
jgi:hypothetical protein